MPVLWPQLDEIKREGKLKLGADADYTNLYRHAHTLTSEARIDAAERTEVENSVVRVLARGLARSSTPRCRRDRVCPRARKGEEATDL